jgi:Tol biopolymer transport system component
MNHALHRPPTRRTPLRKLTTAVLVVATAGSLALATSTAAQAAYPGTDGKITFVRSHQVYSVRSDGSGLRQLTTANQNDHPKWSPDGTRIAYVHHSTGGNSQVWVMNADGSHQQQVTGGHYATEPSWSPDGQWLVYGRSATVGDQDATLSKIRSTAPFGSPITLLGHFEGETDADNATTGVNGTVAWSPTGNDIYYYSHDFPSSPDNYILDLNLTTNVISEVDDIGGACCGEGFFGDLAVSADGSTLGFTSLDYPEDATHPPTQPVIAMLALHAGGGFTAANTVRRDQQPAFAPAGDHVALTNTRNGAKIYVTDTHLAHRRLLTTGSQPDWQPTH